MYKHAAALTVRREDVSLIPRPALFVGWWKSEGPGVRKLHAHALY